MASKLQKSLYDILKMAYPDARYDFKIFGKEIDIYIPSLAMAIEYDGSLYHALKQQQDIDKSIYLEKHGIRVLRIRESPLAFLEGVDCIGMDKNDTFFKVLFYLLDEYGDLSDKVKSVREALFEKGSKAPERSNVPLQFLQWLKERPELVKYVSADGKEHRYRSAYVLDSFSEYSDINGTELRSQLKMDSTFTVNKSTRVGKGACKKCIAINLAEAERKYGIVF